MIGISAFIPSLNYVEITKKGISITSLGFKRKIIYWSKIDRIEVTSLLGVESVGIIYKRTADDATRSNGFRMKFAGWDKMIVNAYNYKGTPLSEDVIRRFKKHSV